MTRPLSNRLALGIALTLLAFIGVVIRNADAFDSWGGF